jgi:hypothetical protein
MSNSIQNKREIQTKTQNPEIILQKTNRNIQAKTKLFPEEKLIEKQKLNSAA